MTLAIPNVGAAAPWRDPQLTSLHRLPMHTLRHDDPANRSSSTGRGASSSSARRTPSPGRTGREAEVPGCWTMAGHSATCPTTRTSRCRSRACRRTIPDDEPDRRLRARRSRSRPAGRGRRIVLHVGAAESVLIVALNGERGRASARTRTSPRSST